MSENHKIPETPEAIAYLLMLEIFEVEKITLAKSAPFSGRTLATRENILETYAECLKIVKSL
jgi:hypothetical protein